MWPCAWAGRAAAKAWGQHDRGPQVGVQMGVPSFRGRRGQAVVLEGRGAVDQQGDRAKGLGGAVDQAGGLGLVRQLGVEDDGAAA